MKIDRTKLKDYFTDIIGAVIMVVVLVTVYTGKTPWIWEGIAGMLVGATFFLLPDGFMVTALKNFLNKKSND